MKKTVRGWVLAWLAAAAMAPMQVDAQTRSVEPGSAADSQLSSTERPVAISRQGLDDPALKLTTLQKARIDSLIEDYMTEQRRVAAGYLPSPGGGAPNAEMLRSMAANRDKLTSSVNKVLDESQRKTWEAAQKAALPRRGISPKGTVPAEWPNARNPK